MLELDKCWSCLIVNNKRTRESIQAELGFLFWCQGGDCCDWHKNKILLPSTWDSFVVCVPSLNIILYSISSWKVLIIGYYSVCCNCKKNTVSQLGFLVLCFKPKTGGCKRGQSVLKGLSTSCAVTISLQFSL